MTACFGTSCLTFSVAATLYDEPAAARPATTSALAATPNVTLPILPNIALPVLRSLSASAFTDCSPRVRFGLALRADGHKALVDTARKAFVATLVVLGVVVLALALWKVRLVVALLFAGFIVAAAIRPSIESLHRRGIPRGVGLFLHYGLFAGVIALGLWFAVPRASHQVTSGIQNLPETRKAIGAEAKQSSGIKQDVLLSLQRRLKEVPSGRTLFTTVKTVGMTAFEVAVGIFFVFAVAGYWIFERDRAMKVVAELLPGPGASASATHGC